jgi:hypothetical protein
VSDSPGREAILRQVPLSREVRDDQLREFIRHAIRHSAAKGAEGDTETSFVVFLVSSSHDAAIHAETDRRYRDALRG